MQKRIDSLSNENDSLRQELIDLRRRVSISGRPAAELTTK
jgi:hypothetical protein